MSERDLRVPLVAGVIGCGLLMVLVGVGSMLLFRVDQVGGGASSPGTPSVIEAGYTLESGALEVDEAGDWKTTLHVRMTEDWTVEEFLVLGKYLQVGLDRHDVELLSLLPGPPIREDFDLVFRLRPPAAAELEGVTPALWLEISSRASEDGLFGRNTSTSRSRSFLVDREAGVLRVP